MNYIEKRASAVNETTNLFSKIVFPEGEDDRVIEAVKLIRAKNFKITPILLGNKEIISKKITDVEIIDPASADTTELLELFLKIRGEKLTRSDGEKLVKQANYFGTLMVEAGLADGLVGGCVYSTADMLRGALQIIKTKPGYKTASSSFLMTKDSSLYLFADCAINIHPTTQQLVDITKGTIETAKFLGIEPLNVAMLSFSTKGSGKDATVDTVVEATKILQAEELGANIDGELQFDAAIDKMVASQKAKDSIVAGNANIFIFPSIESGNIGYKITQRLGGYDAVGPILQGFNKPFADLSRGASDYDIFLTSLIIFLQAQGRNANQ